MDFVFGYGSLVNASTLREASHATKAKVSGYVRSWGHRIDTPFGKVTALNLVEDASFNVQGVALPLDQSAEKELSAREIGYERKPIDRNGFVLSPFQPINTQLYYYRSRNTAQQADENYPILQSYIDVVMMGYFAVFGLVGVQEFCSSTIGWNGYILNDRANPIYPRSLNPADVDTAFIDKVLEDFK